MKQPIRQSSYRLSESQKVYLLKKAYDLGYTQAQMLRVIMNDYMERNPLRK